jgi:DNA-binding XRE family transcriptional regulator
MGTARPVWQQERGALLGIACHGAGQETRTAHVLPECCTSVLVQGYTAAVRGKRRPGLLERWCADAGLRPAPRTMQALARGVGLRQPCVWRIVAGRRTPSLRTAVRLATELRLPLDAVARACLLASERWERQEAAERARVEALER